ncbi:MAG: 50S ribosomal protein L10 [Candidatus Dadabacteria bacterium]|nr:MAG: 50S ribosomal protein L10 [Candidatus Dadabacteria bacterium]
MERAQKDQIIKEMSDGVKTAQIVFCADYRGLTVAEMTELRRGLRESGARGQVIKNTLAKRAIKAAVGDVEEEELEKLLAVFEGPSFVVLSEDNAVSPAKVLANFAKDHKALQIKGAWYENAFVDPAGVEAISKMPSKEELQARLLQVLQGPATQVVQLLKAPARQLVMLLEAYRKKLEEEGK